MPRLTPNEAALWRLLQARRGQAVPRAELLAGFLFCQPTRR